MRKRTAIILLLLVLSIAFGLRLWGITWGLPQSPYWHVLYHPDERVGFNIVHRITGQQNSLNPHYFINPSWHYYTMGMVYKAGGWLNLIQPFKEQKSEQTRLSDVTDTCVSLRLISVILGTMTVGVAFLIASMLFKSNLAGLLTALLTAINPLLVVQSHYSTVDGPAVFWFLLAFYFLLASRKKRLGFTLLAGVLGGLAIATKYTALAIIFPAAVAFMPFPVAAANGTDWSKCFRQISWYSFGLLSGFLIGCPYALLAFGEFRRNLSLMSSYTDFAVNFAYPWLISSRLAMGWPLWTLFLVSMVISIFKMTRNEIMLVSVISFFLLMLGYRASPYFRHLLLVLPFMLFIIVNATVKIWNRAWFIKKVLIKACWAIWLIFGIFYSTANSVAWVNIMAHQDIREEAADFLHHHYAIGSSIAVPGIYEFYNPPLGDYDIIRLEYSLSRLYSAAPKVIVVSNYEKEALTFSKVSQAEADDFFRVIENNYRIVKRFSKTPRFLGLRFEGYPVSDWRYFYPDITIYERSF